MTKTASSPASVQATGLTKRYGRKRALDGVDLTVSGAGVLALLGPNGAGKTSFVQTALGLTPPSSGTLRVFGGQPGAMANRRRIGVMMQDADLPDTLTGRELLTLFASYYPDPEPVDALIDRCALGAFAKRAYGKLSGGQKRRVQFALALVGKPDLLFLDEPTTGLDGEARRALWSIVRDTAARGARVILTTHYLEEADALADRVAVMQDGRIIADDTAQGLRDQVGGALVRCETALDDAALGALDGVRRVRRSGRRAEILVADPVAFLKALFAADPTPGDLIVRQPTLEEAFDALTSGKETA